MYYHMKSIHPVIKEKSLETIKTSFNKEKISSFDLVLASPLETVYSINIVKFVLCHSYFYIKR